MLDYDDLEYFAADYVEPFVICAPRYIYLPGLMQRFDLTQKKDRESLKEILDAYEKSNN